MTVWVGETPVAQV